MNRLDRYVLGWCFAEEENRHGETCGVLILCCPENHSFGTSVISDMFAVLEYLATRILPSASIVTDVLECRPLEFELEQSFLLLRDRGWSGKKQETSNCDKNEQGREKS